MPLSPHRADPRRDRARFYRSAQNWNFVQSRGIRAAGLCYNGGMMRRCPHLTALATALALCAVHPGYSQTQFAAAPPPQGAAARAQIVLTFPFEDTSEETSPEWLSEGLAELTIERLNGRGYYLLSRQERLDALETAGLPVSNRFSRATMLKIGEEADADEVIFGSYSSDGTTLSVTARVLHLSPPSLSPEFSQSGALSDLMSIHARLAGQLSCALAPARPGAPACGVTNPAVVAFVAQLSAPAPAAFAAYIRGITDSNDDARLRNLREAARLQPQWDAPAFALGDAYFTRRNCEMALPWLTKVPAAGANGVLAGFETGVCHLLRNDPARAQAAFSALVNRSGRPSLAEARSNLGVALARDGKFAEAQAAFEQATRADAEEPDYWINLGLLHLRAQRPDAAVEPLRRALALQPGDAEARTLLALALDQSGSGDQAQAERLKLTGAATRVVMPRNPVAADFVRFDRIRMRSDSGALRPASSAPPGDSSEAADNRRGRQRIELHLDRGRQFLDSGNLDDAQRAFIEALLLAPLDADAHKGLAEVYDKQGRPSDGVREYRAALASRDDLPTRVALAALLLRQDRISEARAELELVLGRDPGNSQAQQLLEQLNDRSGSSP
jgi:Tfp pilus assembly protein PilF/TolB-like protein